VAVTAGTTRGPPVDEHNSSAQAIENRHFLVPMSRYGENREPKPDTQ